MRGIKEEKLPLENYERGPWDKQDMFRA